MNNDHYPINSIQNFRILAEEQTVNIFDQCLDPVKCYRKTLNEKEFEIVNSISQKMVSNLTKRASSILNNSAGKTEELNVLKQLTQLFSQITTD